MEMACFSFLKSFQSIGVRARERLKVNAQEQISAWFFLTEMLVPFDFKPGEGGLNDREPGVIFRTVDTCDMSPWHHHLQPTTRCWICFFQSCSINLGGRAQSSLKNGQEKRDIWPFKRISMRMLAILATQHMGHGQLVVHQLCQEICGSFSCALVLLQEPPFPDLHVMSGHALVQLE
jgi:hypothetical protein